VDLNDRSPVTQLQVTACVFRFELCIPFYSGRSVCPFSGGFSYELSFVLPLKGFEVTYPIFEISITLYEHDCQMLFAI